MDKKLIYADNAATTALSDKALEAMLPYLKNSYGNASSIHSLGYESKKALERSRKTIALALNARINEIFFTSGGSESDNWAIRSSLSMSNAKGKHIIISAIEHSAVFRTAENFEQQGYEVTYLPVDKYGKVSPEQLKNAIRDDTALVSIMMANNEIGTIQPIKELSKIAREMRIPFHTDAVQAVGHIPVDVRDLNIDMLSLSAHKFGGPKGVGALYIKTGLALPPLIIGGGQEKNKRSGTENVPGIVGMAVALEDAVENMEGNIKKTTTMRDKIVASVLQIDGATLTGDPVDRLPGIASFLFSGLESKVIVAELSKLSICASSGSACSSGSTELTRALSGTAMITADAENENGESAKYGALRLSLNESNTDADVDYIIQELPIVIRALRSRKPSPLF